jgi:hypothetical protein
MWSIARPPTPINGNISNAVSMAMLPRLSERKAANGREPGAEKRAIEKIPGGWLEINSEKKRLSV